ncbi:hypothetical protein [Pseudomonas frederiksbergensis]|nr:hypothetical protein [Pseudomonas frederiksbergensis]
MSSFFKAVLIPLTLLSSSLPAMAGMIDFGNVSEVGAGRIGDTADRRGA